MVKHLVFFILIFFIRDIYAADQILFGEITPDEIALQQCVYEKGAHAVVLRNSGEIKLSNGKVFVKHHIRIKILDPYGIDEANIKVPYYIENGYQKIINTKAHTIAVKQNGELHFTEVPSKQFYMVDLGKNWKELRFTFPNVKVGSIIEYQYTVVTENILYLEEWNFQRNIPVIFSDLKLLIPSSLRYQALIQGNRLLKKYRDISTNYWVLENLPSIKDEPFLFNKEDHLEKLKFQLMEYSLDQEYGVFEKMTLMKTWEQLANEVLDSYRFKSYLNKSSIARNELNTLQLKGKSQIEKLQLIYSYVSNNYQWNGKYRRYTYQKFYDFHNRKSGYNSEINLFLTLLLTEAGIEAYPILLSTRSHGLYLKEHPFLSQFNHIGVYAFIEGEEYFLDATDKFRPYFLPAIESLVDVGFLLNKRDPHWWKIPHPQPSRLKFAGVMNIEHSKEINTQFTLLLNNYYATDARRDVFKGGLDSWLTRMVKPYCEVNNKGLEVKDLTNIEKDLILEGRIIAPSAHQKNYTYIQFSPFLLNILNTNPFIDNARNFPVQFPHAIDLEYVLSVNLPRDYQIEKVPESEKVILSNNDGEFEYNLTINGNAILIKIFFSINTLELPPNRYENIREFYFVVTSKLKEEIILKRKL